MAKRNGSAEWHGGDLQAGSGTVKVGDGVFEGGYSADSRFGEGESPLTNPEQLIAAAHAACYTMALNNILATNGHTPDSVHTDAKVTLRFVGNAPTITRIDLATTGNVPGIDQADFQKFADQAKAGCVISRALAGVEEIVLDAKLA
ncbi:MAG TPA: OsmC family peroxiredoxin [Trebonia sp.]|jgi:osmotically inducible protein OsmC|nr:OsmC family peroxiredoxin [Trebonia sp.]